MKTDMNTSGWQSGSSKRKTQMTPQAKCWQPQKNLMTLYLYRPGPYKLIYTVKDKQLDVFYQQQANLSVVTTTSEGWVLLCSENGNVRLDMISTVLGEEVHSKDMVCRFGYAVQERAAGTHCS